MDEVCRRRFLRTLPVRAAAVHLQREISLGAHRGREFAVESPRNTGVLRMYLTEKRFYTVAFFRYNDASPSREGERFLDSFEIREP